MGGQENSTPYKGHNQPISTNITIIVHRLKQQIHHIYLCDGLFQQTLSRRWLNIFCKKKCYITMSFNFRALIRPLMMWLCGLKNETKEILSHVHDAYYKTNLKNFIINHKHVKHKHCMVHVHFDILYQWQGYGSHCSSEQLLQICI